MKDSPGALDPIPPTKMTLPEKVDYLFRTIRPRGRGGYSLREVQEGTRALGYKVSDSTLQQLRSGGRPNPTHHTLEALCKFFGVPAGYFFDEAEEEKIKQELELLVSLRDLRVRSIVTRAVGLSAENLTLLSQVIETMRTLNGVTEAPASLDECPCRGG